MRLAPLLRYAVMLTGDPHQAQDLVQETMVRVQLNWRRVARADSPERYVRRVRIGWRSGWRSTRARSTPSGDRGAFTSAPRRPGTGRRGAGRAGSVRRRSGRFGVGRAGSRRHRRRAAGRRCRRSGWWGRR
ncbi:sigma factor [Micromonospora ureilytica]|uniref:sigma factor n=1 Tax=Micromonospora ureilytica TaxID=709868 RepID=UPI00403A1802